MLKGNMVAGNGIDIIEVGRMKTLVDRWGTRLLEKIFTEEEIKYSESKSFSAQHLAARFASKEAVFKAFENAFPGQVGWRDIEVLNDRNGKPRIRLSGRAKKLKEKEKIDEVIISIAHTRNHAVASVVLTRKSNA